MIIYIVFYVSKETPFLIFAAYRFFKNKCCVGSDLHLLVVAHLDVDKNPALENTKWR
jgi:hypothetical protein